LEDGPAFFGAAWNHPLHCKLLFSFVANTVKMPGFLSPACQELLRIIRYAWNGGGADTVLMV